MGQVRRGVLILSLVLSSRAAFGQEGGSPLSPRPEKREPALSPAIVLMGSLGGSGDHWISEVGFNPEGTIFARSGGGGFTALFAKGGSRCIGVTGDLEKPSTGPQGMNYAVQDTAKNPFDGKAWKFGYHQVAKLLQQPYLNAPSGWKWYDWTEAEAGGLRADSRGVELLFPSSDRFIFHVWRDGGNSVITRDPRDLAKKNSWCHRGGGSASYYLLGDAKSGQPLGGVAYAHRPAARALVDSWGRLYVSQQVEGQKSCLGIEGALACGFSVCDANLKPILGSSFAPEGRILAMALQGNTLVLGGYVESGKAAGSPKTPAPSRTGSASGTQRSDAGNSSFFRPLGEPRSGGGKEALIVILRLWP